MISNLTKVIIDPRCRFNYSSYYIIGLMKMVTKDIEFDINPFVYSTQVRKVYPQGVGIILIDDKNCKKKVYIDFYDSNRVFDEAYLWSDLYAKINISKKEDVNIREKLFSIGPSFSIKLFNYFSLIRLLILNYYKLRDSFDIPFTELLRDYLYTNIRRLNFDEYLNKEKASENYIFSCSTFWNYENEKKTTNIWRLRFFEECKTRNLNFEGGFFLPKGLNKKEYENNYGDIFFTKRISPKQYNYKTKISPFVFNTPAMYGCLGWKLAEYLCMGKAIISTPLNNIMPGDFISGTHYHLIENENEIGVAIDYLLNDKEYRNFLEQNARKYFEEYLSPEMVIQRIFNKVYDNKS